MARSPRRGEARGTPDILVAAVGRLRTGPERRLIDDYLGRIGWRIAEHEVEVTQPLAPAVRRGREAERLLAAVPAGAPLVSLDPAGTSLTSTAFAEMLTRLREQARPVVFAIGGADGHGEAVNRAATLTLTLGAMTWPHGLARVMLAEQLWRAYSLFTGHPYHR